VINFDPMIDLIGKMTYLKGLRLSAENFATVLMKIQNEILSFRCNLG
jgi:hypothetical protein